MSEAADTSRPAGIIRLWVIGAGSTDLLDGLRLHDAAPYEASGFLVHHDATDAGLFARLAAIRPHVIVTFGRVEDHTELGAAPLDVRRRWLHVDDAQPDLPALAQRVMVAVIENATRHRFPDVPLVSVFTPTYRTAAGVRRLYESILAQTYPEWEWVVYDDSDDGGATFAILAELADADARVKPFRGSRRSGSIGEVKRRACGLCSGRLLVELDHDDQLLPRCLERVMQAAATYPEAGFFYSDAAEVDGGGRPVVYGDGWGFGFGSYRREVIAGRELYVQSYPPVNSKTIRHITGAPNHVRAWTADAYQRCGGHSPDLDVCDDYDLVVRMFLTTRIVHIPECCYIQVHGDRHGGNTQRTRNPEIQRLTRYLAARYEEEIHARFVELGVDDFIRTPDGRLDWSRPGPPGGAPANLALRLRSGSR